MKAITFFISLFFCFSVYSEGSSACLKSKALKSFLPKYAKHFRIDYFQNYKVVHVGSDAYLLSQSEVNCAEIFHAKIRTPVKRAAFMSTTYLPALEILGKTETLIAFQGKQYIVSKSFDKSKLRDLAFKFNPEELITLKSDLVMGYSSNLSDEKQKQTFRKLSLPVVVNKDFEELTPLARAEWLIFISAFYNMEDKGISVFNEIENNYNELKKKNERLSKTKILVGSIDNGYWMTCGGKSDLAQLISDAGGELAFKNNSNETQKVSLEKLIKNKAVYDVWLTHNMWRSESDKLKAIQDDQRYRYVKAKSVYNNNLNSNENGATDFWETAVQRPDLLLHELSVLFHPESYQAPLKWYRKI